jgi:hypothetical protein
MRIRKNPLTPLAAVVAGLLAGSWVTGTTSWLLTRAA